MKKKSIQSVLILAVFYYIIISLSSCTKEENPVIQQVEGFDSARFNVRVDTIPLMESLKFYAADTSNLFFCGWEDFAYYDGISYHRISFSDGFSTSSICGTDKNNVYIGGEDSRTGRPRLKKWNGAGFAEITVIDSTNNTYPIENLFVKTPNEIWMMAGDKSILRFDGIEFKRYDFESLIDSSSIYYSFFLVDNSGNLCCSRYRDSSDIHHTTGKASFKFYKFINDNWVYYSYHEYIYHQSEVLLPINISNDIYSCSKSGIYKFDGYNFSKILNVSTFEMDEVFLNLRTVSVNNFLITGNIRNRLNILNWNGKKWSIENDKNIDYFFYPYYSFNDKIIGFGSTEYFTLVYFFTKKH